MAKKQSKKAKAKKDLVITPDKLLRGVNPYQRNVSSGVARQKPLPILPPPPLKNINAAAQLTGENIASIAPSVGASFLETGGNAVNFITPFLKSGQPLLSAANKIREYQEKNPSLNRPIGKGVGNIGGMIAGSLLPIGAGASAGQAVGKGLVSKIPSSLPKIKKYTPLIATSIGGTTGATAALEGRLPNKKELAIDLALTGVFMGAAPLYKAIKYKNVSVAGDEIKTATKQLTSGRNLGATENGLKVAREILADNAKGDRLIKAIKEGADLKVQRDFLSWFKGLGSKVKTNNPQIAGLLEEINTKAINKVPDGQVNSYVNRAINILRPQEKGLVMPRVTESSGLGARGLIKPQTPMQLMPGFAKLPQNSRPFMEPKKPNYEPYFPDLAGMKDSVNANAVQLSLGKQDRQKYLIDFKEKEVFENLDKNNINTDQDAVEIYNFFDNPKKYPLNPTTQIRLGGTLKQIEDFKQLLTKEQVDRGLLNSVIDDAEYIRTFIVQKDGSKPTATQINNMLKAADEDKSVYNRLLGIRQSQGTSGLSTRNRYDVSRKFQNADERDAWLDQFNLKTDRNAFRVLKKTSDQVKSITSNYDFVQAMRQLAKQEFRGVREIYDPIEYKDFRENLFDSVSALRQQILQEGKTEKFLNIESYKDLKEQKIAEVKALKVENSKAFDNPKDIRDLMKRQFDQDIRDLRSLLLEDLKGANQEVRNSVLKRLESLKKLKEQELKKYVNKVGDKIAELDEAGFNKMTKHTKIASKLTGLVFDEPTARALDNVFEVLPPSSLEDIAQTVKKLTLAGDLFMVPELVRQRYASVGVKGLLAPWNLDEKTLYEDGLDAIDAGLRLERPEDIAVDFLKKFGDELADVEKSLAAQFFQNVKDKADKIPGVKQGLDTVLGFYDKLENFQYGKLMPTAKLVIWKKLWPEILKQARRQPGLVSFKIDRSSELFDALSEKEAKIMAAEFLNDAFQGLNWNRIAASDKGLEKYITKQSARTARILLTGPDKSMSMFNRVRKMAPGADKIKDRLYQKMFVRSILTFIGVGTLINYMFNGHSTLENRRGGEFYVQIPQIKDEAGNPLQINLFGTWIEPLELINKGVPRYLSGKTGTIGRFLGIGDTDKYAPKTVKEALIQSAPIPLASQSLLNPLFRDKYSLPKTGDTNFGTAGVQAGLEFFGFPNYFRSGLNQQATMLDVLRGNADFWDVQVGNPMLSEENLLKQQIDKYVKNNKFQDADRLISEQVLNNPNFSPSTKKQLREYFIDLKNQKIRLDQDGDFSPKDYSPSEWVQKNRVQLDKLKLQWESSNKSSELRKQINNEIQKNFSSPTSKHFMALNDYVFSIPK